MLRNGASISKEEVRKSMFIELSDTTWATHMVTGDPLLEAVKQYNEHVRILMNEKVKSVLLVLDPLKGLASVYL